MIDYNKIIHSIVDCLVIDCKDIDIRVDESGKNVNIFITTGSENISRLIGKNGRTANIIREIVGITGKENDQFTHVYFKNRIESNS